MTQLAVPGADLDTLRQTFSLFPSGIAAVAAHVDGAKEVLVASSFQVGISAEPPLVLFSVQRSSRTWPRLRVAPRLGISVLGRDHDAVCRQLAAREGDRFAGVGCCTTPEGAVLLHGAPVWFECSIEQEVAAGDHDLVLLRVRRSGSEPSTPPLVFHRSQFVGLAAS